MNKVSFKTSLASLGSLMPGRTLLPSVTPLSELTDGQEADFFAVLASKDELKTREGKPYWRVTFRDGACEVSFPIWSDSAWAADCRDAWRTGTFYKLRAGYRETNYGPQLDIKKIRETNDADRGEGFDPADFLPRSRFDPAAKFAELCALVREHVASGPLQKLLLHLLVAHQGELLVLPAASHNHHSFVGGWVEHVVSVTRTCAYLAEKYADYYRDLQPPLSKDLVVAGGVLHDIGKLRELRVTALGAEYTPAGDMIGHILQGRDMLREAAAVCPIDQETLLRLEHVIVSHQRLPEWGSPKPPMTPEALLVHYADDIDAKFAMVTAILAQDSPGKPMTSKKNYLQQKFYRGPAS